MKVMLAASERFSGCMIEALERRGHRVVATVLPRAGAYEPHPAGLAGLWFRTRGWEIYSCCRRRGIPMAFSRRLEEEAVTRLIKERRPDLLLLFRWPTRVTSNTLNRFAYGGMNIHPTMLPAMRGADPLFAMVDQGIDAFGVTFHKVVEEIDAGPILLQERLRFKAGDTCDDLYFRLLEGAFSHLPRAINKLLLDPDGTPQRGAPTVVGRFRQRMRLLDPAGEPEAEMARTRACFSRYTRLTAVGDQLIHFRTATNLSRFELCHKGVGVIQQVGLSSMVINLGYHAVRLGGIRFHGRPAWQTPYLLSRLEIPGSVLADVAGVRALWKAARA